MNVLPMLKFLFQLIQTRKVFVISNKPVSVVAAVFGTVDTVFALLDNVGEVVDDVCAPTTSGVVVVWKVTLPVYSAGKTWDYSTREQLNQKKLQTCSHIDVHSTNTCVNIWRLPKT